MDAESTPLYLQFYQAMLRMKHASRKLPSPHEGISHFDFLSLNLIRGYQENHPDLPGMKVSLLCEKMELSRSAMSQHINALEAKDFIIRTASKTDRRVTYLSLTDHAHTLLQESKEAFLMQIKAVCDMLGREDTETIIALTDKISQIYVSLSKNPLPEVSPLF